LTNINLIQTLYFNKSANPYKHTFGWAAPEYHLMSWALSCLQLVKMYGSVDLFCNSEGAKLLIDKLLLPYHQVHVTHDDLIIPNVNLWALPKIYTYSLQAEPFLHIDGDVFIFKAFEESLLKSDLIAQNMEEATEYYLSVQNEIITYFNYLPECVKNDFNKPYPIKAVNAGILGGSNIDFFNKYSKEAFNYINRNIDKLSLINADRFNVFFEQHLFYSFANEKEIPISLLFPETIIDNEYQHLAEFREIPCNKSYLHLLGHYKKDEYTCNQMTEKFRELYPDYYYRIIALCRKENISHSTKEFYANKFSNFKGFLAFNEVAKKEYYQILDQSCDKELKIQGNSTPDTIPDFVFLNDFINSLKLSTNYPIDLNSLQNDLNHFYTKLSNFLSYQYTSIYLYGRDLESLNWYCDIFNSDKLGEKEIICCKEICIVESEYNWAGILSKYKRVGIPYYRDLEIIKGHFINLIVPEVSDCQITMFDLDEMEKVILEKLFVPMSVGLLLSAMEVFVENDVLINHREVYNNLILTLIKQLVIKKAIKPHRSIEKTA